MPGCDQRDTCTYASIVDLDEAYRVGQKAAEIAATMDLRATVLAVAGAFHSPLMQPAADVMADALATPMRARSGPITQNEARIFDTSS